MNSIDADAVIESLTSDSEPRFNEKILKLICVN